MNGEPRPETLARLLARSSLGGAPLDELCARTPQSSVDGILLKASLQAPEGTAGEDTDLMGDGGKTAFGAWLGRTLSSSRIPRVEAVVVIVTTLVVAAFIALPRLGLIRGQAEVALVDLVPALAAFTGAGLCFRAARRRVLPRSSRESPALATGRYLLGLAALSWGLGELAWTWYELRGLTVPVPSLADVGYQFAIPFLTAGLLVLISIDRFSAARVRVVVDGCVLGLSVAGLLWLASAAQLFGADPSAPSGPLSRYLLLSYAIVDVVVLAVAGTALARTKPSLAVRMDLVFVALACLTAGDVGFLYETQQGSYASGNLVDLGWTFGFVVLGLAAGQLGFGTARARTSVVPQVLRTIVLPNAAAASLLVGVTATAFSSRHVDPLVAGDTIIVVLLSFGRLAIIGVQSSRLCQQLLTRTVALADEMSDLHRSTDSALADLVGDLPRMRAESVLDSILIRTQIMEQQAAGLLRDADRLQQRLGGAGSR